MNDPGTHDSRPAAPRTARDLIDFYDERARHGQFFGREAILAEMDAFLLDVHRTSGWLLVQGGPGLGKSALLSRWLGPPDAPRWPHHFIRRGILGWDQPARIAASLAAQVEARYPDLADPDAAQERRLGELLGRVSQKVLRPRGERLVLLVDGLDEASSDDGQNPLPRFLPALLPTGVFVLCASRPDYPNLNWLTKQPGLHPMDLDAPRWKQENEATCSAFWTYHGPLLSPPLSAEFADEAAMRAQGNLLHAVKLLQWLETAPPQERVAARIPHGLRALLEEIWDRFLQMPTERRDRVLTGLGLLCAAREALPLGVLEQVAGWADPLDKDDFLRAVRSFLLEQPAHWEGRVAYRPYHESFREFIAEMLGEPAMRRHHNVLARALANWPPAPGADAFRRRYARRHAMSQHIEAEVWEGVDRLCRDLTYLRARYEEAGVQGAEADLALALARGPDEASGEGVASADRWAGRQPVWRDVLRALRDESHWWRKDADALPGLVYNRLRCQGWSDERIRRELALGMTGKARLLLEHPLQHQGSRACIRTLSGHSHVIRACAVTADGKHVVSASDDKTLKVWDLATGHELLTFSGHSESVIACAVTPDGTRMISASWDDTLKVWDLNSGHELLTFLGHSKGVTACVVTPDGTRMVSASDDKTLKVWDLATGHELLTLSGHSDWVDACVVTADGTRVISTSHDKMLKVWDLDSGHELLTLSGHSRSVSACAVTADGTRVVSASRDKTLKVWDLDSGACLATLYGTSLFSCVTTHGGRICAGDHLGNVWMLHLVAAEPQLSTLSPAPPTSGTLSPNPMSKNLIYIGYAHSKDGKERDDALARELEAQLAPLEKLNPPLPHWSERNIQAGATTDREIEDHLSRASIILLVVTANFLADDHCQKLLHRALKLQKDGQATVIPIIANYCQWDLTPLGQLSPLPERDRPVKAFANRDEAWDKVVRGIREVAASPPAAISSPAIASSPLPATLKPAKVRKLLSAMLIGDNDFDGFCQDNFAAVRGRFSNGMDRVSKSNLLLQYIPLPDIVAALEEHDATVFATYKNLLF